MDFLKNVMVTTVSLVTAGLILQTVNHATLAAVNAIEKYKTKSAT